jgi:type IV pilus assembly protein PilY1
MKTRFQLVFCAAALGTLLAGAASGNTPLSDLPLRSSALAKPNVIFSMDDSGSMDWELLLDTGNGVAWWDGTSAWNTAAGKPLAISPNVPYAYLFPLGSGAGGAVYNAGSTYGQAVPPINQLAWLRSAQFNPSYYDTRITYRPWAPATLGETLRNWPDANPAAASAHPAVPGAPTLALNQAWTAANTQFMAEGYRFYVQAGMSLPPGAVVRTSNAGAGGQPCTGETEQTLVANQTVPAGAACWASIPYYPATFWQAEACTLGPDCVARPDGAGTLRRYEIRPGAAGFPSGRGYAAEMQNFANWFSYYRKRKLMLAASMGQVLENISGLRLGVDPFNVKRPITMYDADAASETANRFAAAGQFYLNGMQMLGTPTHAAMKQAAAHFEADTGVVQYACQRNNLFVVTDGFSNSASTEVPSYDRSRFGGTAPYAPTAEGSLADLGLLFYTQRLRTDLPAGRVPISASTAPNADRNPDLHINTYGLSLGVRGSVWPTNLDPFVTAPNWPTPVGDTPAMLDDLWHATLNGRGQMYLATTPQETAASIKAGLEDILANKGAQGGFSVSSVNLGRGDGRAYLASYDPAGWTGDLEAVPLNADTGELAPIAAWSAADNLNARPWTERVIATHNGSTGVGFTAGNIGSLLNPGNAWGPTEALVAYLRGNRSGEGTQYKLRQSLLGAVINAEPAIDRDTQVAYLATGEGMLHAFDLRDSAPGRELWAYVPGLKLADLGRTSARSWSFRTQLDGTPVLRRLDDGSKLLVAGMGVAGRGYFAIDVSNPRGLSEAALASRVKWEFPRVGDAAMAAKMGQTVGRPYIVKLQGGATVVLVSSGYNNSFDGRGRLWVLNPANGEVIKEFVTPEGTPGAEAGLAQFSPFAEADGSVREVFAGDLLGNVWRIDLLANPAAAGAVTKLAQLRDPSNNPQPVTAAPELMAWQGQRVVLVGTGRLLDPSDFGSPRVQSFYAIASGAPLANVRSQLVQRNLNVAGNGSLTGAEFSWATQRGWYLDLPPGEHVNHRPALAYGAVAFVANRTGGSNCEASARLLVVDVLTGGRFARSEFVSTVLSSNSNTSGVTALLTRDGQTLRFNARDYSSGKGVGRGISAGVPITPLKNSWREIRR